jgi:hypothetical protein
MMKCTFYSLHKDIIEELFKNYPALKQEMEKKAKKKQEKHIREKN